MRIFNGLDNLPVFTNAVATMGSFDGVHSGHRVLLDRVKQLATELGGESIVLTFEPHPRYVLGTGDDMLLLTTIDEKLWLLEQMGIDNVIVIPFTTEFSLLSPEEYIEQVVAKLSLRALVVGYNHRFGHKKEGNYDFLERRNDFEVYMVEQQQIVGSKVSSTILRQLLSQGLNAKAATLLGHDYLICATFDEDGSARVDQHKLLPAEGSYDVEANGERSTLHVASDSTLRLEPKVQGKVKIWLK
ncbi:MAG: FAD synthetase family protein, partial [Rikenellaceae bacterium]|nr:FAD synthetase family protein [Rikenellaceae bacterium]